MKKFIITLFILTILGSLSYSAFKVYNMYQEYNETVNWKNSTLANIHETPPELAKNYISIDEERIFKLLTKVNSSVNKMKNQLEIDANKVDEYWSLHDEVKRELEINKDFPKIDVFEQFELYLKVDSAIKNAHKNINIEELKQYSELLSTKLAKENIPLEEEFLNKLTVISNEYDKADKFADNAIKRLGFVKNNNLFVDLNVNQTITDELIYEIEQEELTKFPLVNNLLEILKGNSWAKILSKNQIVHDYNKWKNAESILNSLNKRDFIKISHFKSLNDVLSYNSSHVSPKMEHHTVNNESKVLAVYYNGEQLNENMYVKIGTQLTFEIDYKYTENPKSTITVKYVDENGNEIVGISDEVYTNYVGESLNVEIKEIEGYIFDKVKGNLKFSDDDFEVQVMYKEFVEPEETEEPEESDEDEELDDEDNDIEVEKEDSENENTDESENDKQINDEELI